jgi:hypothetical protein
LTFDRKEHLEARGYQDEEDLEEQQAVLEELPVLKGQGKERARLGTQSLGPIRQ